MEMKWNPIVNGDLSEIPEFGNVLFTIIDEDTDETYVIFDEIYPIYVEDGIVAFYCYGTLDNSEKVIAWMEVPESYRPGRCDICVHLEQWIDNFGDCWSKCKLLKKDDVFPRCPLDD